MASTSTTIIPIGEDDRNEQCSNNKELHFGVFFYSGEKKTAKEKKVQNDQKKLEELSRALKITDFHLNPN